MLSLKQKISLLYTTLYNRWKSETPKIYKAIRNIATVVAFLTPIAASFDAAPHWFTNCKWYLMSGSAIVAGCSQLSKTKDNEGDTVIKVDKTEI